MKMKKVGVTWKPAMPQLKSYKEAIASLEQVQHFLECHGMSVEANALSTTVDHIAAVAMKALKRKPSA